MTMENENRQNIKIAYSGIPGCYGYIVAYRLFDGAKLIAYKNFEKAYEAVLNNQCEKAVLPVENSYAGEVGAVTDLMFNGNLFVEGVYEHKISHCLLGHKGTLKSQIKQVISHPQAIMQCEKFIDKNGFSAREYVNTAEAARFVASEKDYSIVAIASEETAALYGLQVIERGINDSQSNATKFAVFCKNEVEKGKNEKCENVKGNNISILMFSVRNQSGALRDAISIIASYGINMRVIRSRPIKEKNWQYFFYTELEGDMEPENEKNMLMELKRICAKVKFVGRFTADVII